MNTQEYILAGHCTFTLEGPITAYTYRVKELYRVRPKNTPGIWFVQVLCGPNNLHDYRFLGVIRLGRFEPGECWFHRDRRPAIRENAPSSQAFASYWKTLTETGQSPPDWELHRSGHCARCGRLLTAPASIEAGIGPVCASLP